MNDFDLTVGELLEFIKKHNISNDAKIRYQRIEDIYFEKHNWKPIFKEGEFYNQDLEWNESIKSGKYLDKDEYPEMNPDFLVPFTEDEMNQAKEQYVQVFTAIKFPDDNNLYLTAHY